MFWISPRSFGEGRAPKRRAAGEELRLRAARCIRFTVSLAEAAVGLPSIWVCGSCTQGMLRRQKQRRALSGALRGPPPATERVGSRLCRDQRRRETTRSKDGPLAEGGREHGAPWKGLIKRRSLVGWSLGKANNLTRRRRLERPQRESSDRFPPRRSGLLPRCIAPGSSRVP